MNIPVADLAAWRTTHPLECAWNALHYAPWYGLSRHSDQHRNMRYREMHRIMQQRYSPRPKGKGNKAERRAKAQWLANRASMFSWPQDCL